MIGGTRTPAPHEARARPVTTQGRLAAWLKQHRRSVIRIGVVLALAIGLPSLWLARYQPLSRGNAWNYPGTSAGEVVGRDGRSIDVIDVQYRHLEDYLLGTTVMNHGPLPITIRAASLAGHGGTLEHVGLALGPPPLPHSAHVSLSYSAAVPFEAFRLGVNEQRMVWFQMRFNGCDAFGATSHLSEVAFRYEVLGVAKVQRLHLGKNIRIHVVHPSGRPSSPCPVVEPKTQVPGFEVQASLAPYAVVIRSERYEATDCDLTVNDRFHAHVGAIPAREPGDRFAPAATVRRWSDFVTDDAEPWDPATDPLATVRIRCARYLDRAHHPGSYLEFTVAFARGKTRVRDLKQD